jgi:predicted dehydrogenase
LSYAKEFAAFGRSIRDGEPVETDGVGGVYALAVVEASILSAREGRFVRIDELVTGL